MQPPDPKVSVVLVVGNRRERSARALESVLRQEGIDEAEVIVIDAGSDGNAPLPGTDKPYVRLVRADLSQGFGALKATGVRQARAPIVAFMEDHIEVRPGWLNGVVQSMNGPWAAVGGEVHNANARVGVSDAVALINYGLWAPPLERGEASMLAGNNSIYRKELLLRYGDALDEFLISDTVLQWLLAAEGHKLLNEPNVSIRHRNPTTLMSGMKAEFLYHWCFGAARAKAFDWSGWEKARYLVLSPLIPWIRLWRLARLIRQRRSERQVSFLRTIIVAVFLLHAAVLGQAAGIMLGLEGGLKRFTDFELNGPRPMPAS